MVMGQEIVILYVILGALAGIIYSLRRMYILERKLADLELKIDRILEHTKRKK